MRALIIEGDEKLLENEEEDEIYYFKGSPGEMVDFLELTVELRNNSSMRIFIVVNVKYF